MSRLIEIWDKIRSLLAELVARIESTPVYESLLTKFEELDPKQQQILGTSSRIAGLLLIIYFTLSPILGLYQEKSTLHAQRELLAEIKELNLQLATQPQKAPLPRDWQNMPADTSEATMASLRGFVESLGIPSGRYKMLASSNGHLQLEIPQLNLRQAQALVYQVDGWHPRVVTQVLNIQVEPENKNQLSLAMTLRHQSGGAFDVPAEASELDDSYSTDSGSSSSSGGSSSGNYENMPINEPNYGDSYSDESDPYAQAIREEEEAYDLQEQENMDASLDEDLQQLDGEELLPPPPLSDEEF